MSLNTAPRRRTFRIPRAAWITLGAVVLIVAAIVGWQMRPKPEKDPYRLAPIERGDITRSVSASGSLQALNTVDVGSQISGQVIKVLADFNDEVRAGQVLAVLDPQTYQSRVAQSQADIAAGEASVRQAQATLVNAQADYNRKKTLVDQGWNAPSTLDAATAALKAGQANVAAARARVGQSNAALRIQRADLNRTIWPAWSWPTSASSTEIFTSTFDRSWAMVNSTGACRLAATVLPGSTLRSTTMPSMGATMVVRPRSTCWLRRAARLWVTRAAEAATLARATFMAAVA